MCRAVVGAPDIPRRALAARVAGGAVAAGFLFPAVAGAHSAFLGSSPPPGARLERSPAGITITFTEPLNRRLSRAAVVALGSSDRVEARLSATGRRMVLRPDAPLRRGAYRIEWHTVSTRDGHALEGWFSIGVRAAAIGGEHEVQQSPLARDGWVRVLTRWLMYATLLTFCGALFLASVLGDGWLRPATLVTALGASGADGIRARERLLVGELGLATAGLAAAVAAADAYDAGGSLGPATLRDFLLTSSAGLTRLALIALVLVAALAAKSRSRAAALPALLGLCALAASGHAASAPSPGLAVALDAAHLAAASLWIGGIAMLVLVWAPAVRTAGAAVRRALAGHVLPVFGRVALPAFAIVVFSGAGSALIELGTVSALWETGYGRVLAVKMALVGLVAAVSWQHALRLRPRLPADSTASSSSLERRHWRLWRSEPLLGLGVVGAVALLVAFPLPPRQQDEADEASAAVAGAQCDPCPLPRPRADELAVAEHAGAQLVAVWARRRGGALTGTVRVLDVRGRPWSGRFGVAGARLEPCGAGCARFAARPAGRLVVAVRAGRTAYAARLSMRWRPRLAARARDLLRRAQATMRRLRTARETEVVTSGPGSYARTDYVLHAPNRMRLRTSAGTQSVVIGDRQWFRASDAGWMRSTYGAGIPFSTRSWFRWTPYASAVRWIGVGRERGRTVVELALMDPGTPVWTRLWIDRRSRRVLRERTMTRGHYSTARYFGFDAPARIHPPKGHGGT